MFGPATIPRVDSYGVKPAFKCFLTHSDKVMRLCASFQPMKKNQNGMVSSLSRLPACFTKYLAILSQIKVYRLPFLPSESEATRFARRHDGLEMTVPQPVRWLERGKVNC